MAYSIITSPPAGSSAHLPIYFTVFDSIRPQDAVTYPDFKYVADVYVGGNLIARLKAFPDPVNLAGLFDIGPIVRSYFAPNFGSTTWQPYVNAQVRFGNEYDGTTYTNLITDSSRAYWDTYKAGPYESPVVVQPNTWATDRPDNLEAIESALLCFQTTASGTLNYTIGTASGSVLVTAVSGMAQVAVTGTAGNTVTVTANGQSKTVKFVCSPRFPNRKIAFLNKYGGYDTHDFYLISRESIGLERRQYEQRPIRLAASGVISYQANDVFYPGKQTFATRAKQRLSLKSDYLNDAAYRWLGQMATSPEVYLQDDAGKWLPVVPTITEYQYRTSAADRLTIFELDIDLTGDYNTQYR